MEIKSPPFVLFFYFFILVSCGGNKQQEEKATKPEETPQHPIITLTLISTDDSSLSSASSSPNGSDPATSDIPDASLVIEESSVGFSSTAVGNYDLKAIIDHKGRPLHLAPLMAQGPLLMQLEAGDKVGQFIEESKKLGLKQENIDLLYEALGQGAIAMTHKFAHGIAEYFDEGHGGYDSLQARILMGDDYQSIVATDDVSLVLTRTDFDTERYDITLSKVLTFPGCNVPDNCDVQLQLDVSIYLGKDSPNLTGSKNNWNIPLHNSRLIINQFSASNPMGELNLGFSTLPSISFKDLMLNINQSTEGSNGNGKIISKELLSSAFALAMNASYKQVLDAIDGEDRTLLIQGQLTSSNGALSEKYSFETEQFEGVFKTDGLTVTLHTDIHNTALADTQLTAANSSSSSSSTSSSTSSSSSSGNVLPKGGALSLEHRIDGSYQLDPYQDNQGRDLHKANLAAQGPMLAHLDQSNKIDTFMINASTLGLDVDTLDTLYRALGHVSVALARKLAEGMQVVEGNPSMPNIIATCILGGTEQSVIPTDLVERTTTKTQLPKFTKPTTESRENHLTLSHSFILPECELPEAQCKINVEADILVSGLIYSMSYIEGTLHSGIYMPSIKIDIHKLMVSNNTAALDLSNANSSAFEFSELHTSYSDPKNEDASQEKSISAEKFSNSIRGTYTQTLANTQQQLIIDGLFEHKDSPINEKYSWKWDIYKGSVNFKPLTVKLIADVVDKTVNED